jgi:DNA topoisomerase VI subunit A
MKSCVGSVTYRTYINATSADCADATLIGIDPSDNFKEKKEKTLEVLKSDFHILELKKHRAQAEVEMFSEAIARTAGPRSEDGEFAALLELSLLRYI